MIEAARSRNSHPLEGMHKCKSLLSKSRPRSNGPHALIENEAFLTAADLNESSSKGCGGSADVQSFDAVPLTHAGFLF